MSITAYNGFRMNSKDFPTVLRSLEKAGQRLQVLNGQRQTQVLGSLASTFLDRAALGLPLETQASTPSPLGHAFAEVHERQRQIRRSHMRDPEVDFELKFCLWHCRSLDAYIGLLDSEYTGRLLRELLGMRIARDYGYWNNTDAPERMPARQWKQRSDAWTACLYGRSGPSFTIEIPEPSFPNVTQVLAALPTFEERVNRRANERACAEILRTVPGEDDKNFPMEGFFAYQRERLVAGTPAHLAYESAKADIAKVLVPDITEELLLASCKTKAS